MKLGWGAGAVCLERLEGSVDLHSDAGFGRAQGKNTGQSSAGSGVYRRLEAETRDASVEQRPLDFNGEGGSWGFQSPPHLICFLSSQDMHSHLSRKSRVGSGGGGEVPSHQLLNLVFLGCCLWCWG